MELAAPGARGGPERLDGQAVVTAAYVVGALAIAGGATAIAAAAGDPPLAVLARGLIAGVPAAVGVRALLRQDNRRFGLLLVATGALLALTTLGDSGNELAYSTGRALGWPAEILLIYLILSFPTGRLPSSTDRALVGAGIVVVLTLFLPRLFLAGEFETPSPYTSCTSDCPSNAFFLLDHQAGFVNGFMRPAGALLMVALSAAVVVRMRERVRERTELARRMFIPVLAVGMARMGLLALGFAARAADPSAWPVEVLAWSLAFSALAIALAFQLSSLRWQLAAGTGLHRLAEWVREVPDVSTLRRAMADAFGDRNLRILIPADGPGTGWVDAETAAVASAAPGAGLAVSELRDYRESVVAAVIHDEALLVSPRFLEAGLGIAGVVLTNQRLAGEAEEATREVERSRTRIAATAERERRRIERDLHDGAQQRLVALRIELELAEEIVRRDPDLGIGRLQELERDVDEALEELRALAHGVYPPLLADRGLDEAIRRVTARCPLPVHVNLHDVERYTPEVESAVYFCIVEALQNVLKHAAEARHVIVRLDGGFPTQLRFSVRDDGAGARDDRIEEGAGITNMRDRLAPLGGEVTVTSLRAVGTAVRGRVPTLTQRVP